MLCSSGRFLFCRDKNRFAASACATDVGIKQHRLHLIIIMYTHNRRVMSFEQLPTKQVITGVYWSRKDNSHRVCAMLTSAFADIPF